MGKKSYQSDNTGRLFQKGWSNPKHSGTQIVGETSQSQTNRKLHQQVRGRA